jgi:HD superfamily phosphohydrolase
MNKKNDIHTSRTVNFADVAHGTLIFDRKHPVDSLILKLIDTRWVQRLRRISQTGNTKLVYMFAEHSRFGHCLGAAYLASLLMRHLSEQAPDMITPYQQAIGAAAILHDVGHLAPGSHLAERTWSKGPDFISHEALTKKIICEDTEIKDILESESPGLTETVTKILAGDPSLPSWTYTMISGGGWNVDRGNWSIVDSMMCAVSYGRYNVTALIDAFRITDEGEIVIQESRLDALTHFFVARNSMYRQVYQHRVLQSADALTALLVKRVRECGPQASEDLFCDPIMHKMLFAEDYANELSLSELFEVNESWWEYHLSHWRKAKDSIVKDLSRRLLDRDLFKTVHLPLNKEGDFTPESTTTIEMAKKIAQEYSLSPKYYTVIIKEKDKHRAKSETPPRVLQESGELTEVKHAEPLVDLLTERSKTPRAWIAVPTEVKSKMGFRR